MRRGNQSVMEHSKGWFCFPIFVMRIVVILLLRVKNWQKSLPIIHEFEYIPIRCLKTIWSTLVENSTLTFCGACFHFLTIQVVAMVMRTMTKYNGDVTYYAKSLPPSTEWWMGMITTMSYFYVIKFRWKNLHPFPPSIQVEQNSTFCAEIKFWQSFVRRNWLLLSGPPGCKCNKSILQDKVVAVKRFSKFPLKVY